MKAIHDKPRANIILNREKLKSISFMIRNKTMMPTLTTFIQHSILIPSHSNQRRKRNKGNPNWKEVKLSLFADDMTVYIENPKTPPKNY